MSEEERDSTGRGVAAGAQEGTGASRDGEPGSAGRLGAAEAGAGDEPAGAPDYPEELWGVLDET
jgi:hypothetical protein